MPINLVLVEDHSAMRKGLELLLQPAGVAVVGSARNAEQGVELVLDRRPDVALVDMNLPEANGTWLTERVMERLPSVGVLIYTGLPDQEEIARALAAGARGVALKAGQPEELVEAIMSVAGGGSYIDSRLAGLEHGGLGSGAPASGASGLVPVDEPGLELFEDADIADLCNSVLSLMQKELGLDVAWIGQIGGGDEVVEFLEGDADSFGLGPKARLRLEDTYCLRVLSGRLPSAVPDTRRNDLTADLPVTFEANVGAYIGVPIRFSDRRLYGMLCGMAHAPRPRLRDDAVAFTQRLGQAIAEEMEQRDLEARYRLTAAELDSVRRARRQHLVRELVTDLCRLRAQGRTLESSPHVMTAILSGRERPESPRDALLVRYRSYLASARTPSGGAASRGTPRS